jgi:hypothetical protein
MNSLIPKSNWGLRPPRKMAYIGIDTPVAVSNKVRMAVGHGKRPNNWIPDAGDEAPESFRIGQNATVSPKVRAIPRQRANVTEHEGYPIDSASQTTVQGNIFPLR